MKSQERDILKKCGHIYETQSKSRAQTMNGNRKVRREECAATLKPCETPPRAARTGRAPSTAPHRTLWQREPRRAAVSTADSDRQKQ